MTRMKLLVPLALLLLTSGAAPAAAAKAPNQGGKPAPLATASRAPFSDPGTGMKFVWVKGGCFQMGDNFDDEKAAKPVHEVCVSDFAIGKFEVTQKQWMKIMGSNPSQMTKFGENCPVDSVTWEGIQDFVAKLNSISGSNFRLPTEAEWEYAGRSGGKMERYAGTSDIKKVRSYIWDADNTNTTHPGGKKKPNGLGIYDMGGNVSEWVQDIFGDYSSERQQDPTGPKQGEEHVVRGGGWPNGEVGMAARWGSGKFYGSSELGFRLALPAR
jgi:formylglycine-generating enzyme